MTKYIQFTQINGNLIYRNTGQYYTKAYTIKGKTVYGANGRKIGMLGAPTKKQKAVIQKAMTNRFKKVSKNTKQALQQLERGELSFRDYALIQETVAIDPTQYSKSQKELYNLSKRLKGIVDSGMMTEDKADAYVRRWLNASKDERTKVWNELKSYEKDVGYQPPSP